MRVHPKAPVLALDVDGTIADYYEHFRWFAELYLQKELVADWSSGTDQFSEALGLDLALYRQIKLAYRQGGMKRCIPPLDEGLRHFIPQIRARLGVQIWICTTRPWQRLDNIDPDTQFWLGRNVGRVDGVIYGEDKYEDLIDLVGKDRILGVIDDLPENIRRAGSLGLRSAIYSGDHNKFWRESISPGVTDSVHSAESILSTTEAWFSDYNNGRSND